MTTYTVTLYDDVINANDNQLGVREAVTQAVATPEDDTIVRPRRRSP